MAIWQELILALFFRKYKYNNYQQLINIFCNFNNKS